MKSEQLRILHLVLLRFWNAVAWYAIAMAKALERRGHTCWIAGAQDSPILQAVVREGMATADGLHLTQLRPWNWVQTIARMRAFLVARGVDVVFVHTGSGHLEMHLARRGLPTGLVRVRADARHPRADPGHRWLYRNGADRIVASGAYMLSQHLKGWDLAPERLLHLPPGIDLHAIEEEPALKPSRARSAIRKRYGLPPDTPLIGIIGRLSPVKGHEILIRACRILVQQGYDFRLLVVGAQKEIPAKTLRHLAGSLGMEDHLVLTGFVEDPLVHAAALDIGVIPSLGSEAVSRSALEYMAVGVPVVASRVGVLPELIDQEECLVPQGEPESLAAALSLLLHDPETAREWGWMGRERVRSNYSMGLFGERAERVAVEARARRRF